jgi:hypothetical protein
MVHTFSNKEYFDLHTSGLGYLNRIREVRPKRGDAFLACGIAALNGPTDDVEYRRFDVKVTGGDAKLLVERYAPAVRANRRVLIGFLIGDLWTDLFTQTKGAHVGMPAVGLKGRLLGISWIKLDGKLVYTVRSRRRDAREEIPHIPHPEAPIPDHEPEGSVPMAAMEEA